MFNIFEGLVKPDENGNLINAVASDYTISEDGLVYTFTLRDNVKFHNGNVVTCEDVKYSLERVSGLLDGTPLISTLKTIQAVDILDEKTVQVTVESANTELIYSFVAAIIPVGRRGGGSHWYGAVFLCLLYASGGDCAEEKSGLLAGGSALSG